MDWQPPQQNLAQILSLLKNTTSSDNELQRRVHKELENIQLNVPEYPCYLVYIFTQLKTEEQHTRSLAGFGLKQYLKMYYNKISPQVMQYIQKCCLDALVDPNKPIRDVVGTIISTIMSIVKVDGWQDCLPKLLTLIGSNQTEAKESALSTVTKICEDCTDDLIRSPSNPLAVIIPKLIELFGDPSPRVVVNAMISLNQFLAGDCQVMNASLDQFLQALFSRATDSNSDIRRQVCQAIVKVSEFHVDKLIPQLDNIVQYMLACTQDPDENVALEACEFWLAFAEQEDGRRLMPYLGHIVPVLLKCMVYSDDEIMQLGGDEEDSHLPDREQDIKPHHYHAKTHGQSSTPTGDKEKGSKEEGEASDSDYDEYASDDDFNVSAEWTLRKCSAAALDVLATYLGEQILPHLLPLLKQELFADDWKHRECGILALGAIAEGCMGGIEPHLPDLVPFLFSRLDEQKFLVRSITCWTLGRYSSWCTHQDPKKFLEPLMTGLLRMVLDKNKRVQEAGCSAFATLEEEAGTALVPYLDPIVRNLVHAFNTYQHKNLMILYDAIGTLADSVGSALNEPNLIQILMPPLINKWNILTDEDRDLFPLLECLSSIAQALGHGFLDFAPPVFERCVKLIHRTIQQDQAHRQNPQVDIPDKDFMIVALDLLSALAQGLAGSVESLVASSQPNLFELLNVGLRDPIPEVRQSAYALLGDLTIACFPYVQPHVQTYVQLVIAQINYYEDPPSVRCCNNAIWAAGEIALKNGANMQPYVQPLLEKMLPLLNGAYGRGSPPTLLENCAITIGRLGLVCPQVVAPHMESFAFNWCRALKFIRDNPEKESAFLGFCAMIEANPNGIVKHLGLFCETVVYWKKPSEHLNEQFRRIFAAFKQMMGAQWDPWFNSLPPNVSNELKKRYPM